VSDTRAGRILVADDHKLIVTLLQRTFEDAGYEVTAVMDAAEVADAARRDRPDLAVLDAQMKPYERFHALRTLRALELEQRPAVIVLSGHDEAAVRQVALELGADAFMLKPWEEDELMAVAQRLISRPGGAERTS
jgi:DNA-binding response OmpR family regulator